MVLLALGHPRALPPADATVNVVASQVCVSLDYLRQTPFYLSSLSISHYFLLSHLISRTGVVTHKHTHADTHSNTDGHKQTQTCPDNNVKTHQHTHAYSHKHYIHMHAFMSNLLTATCLCPASVPFRARWDWLPSSSPSSSSTMRRR